MLQIKHFNHEIPSYISKLQKSKPSKNFKSCCVSFRVTDLGRTLQPSKLKRSLKSIMDQTAKVNSFVINSPPAFNLKERNDLEELKTVITMFQIGRDYKVANCIIPCLMREGEQDTAIICLTDDYIYGKDFLEALLEESSGHPDSIIIWNDSAVLIKPNFFTASAIEEVPSESDLISWIQKHSKAPTRNIRYYENYKL